MDFSRALVDWMQFVGMKPIEMIQKRLGDLQSSDLTERQSLARGIY
jgi:hypothetical protein